MVDFGLHGQGNRSMEMSQYDVSTFIGEKNTGLMFANECTVIEYIHKLLSASSLDELHKICVLICYQYGFDFFTTMIHLHRRDRPTSIFRMVEYANKFTIHYEKNRFYLIDPGIRIARSAATPYVLSSKTGKLDMSDVEKAVIVDASDFGMRDVFYAPFHGSGGDFGIVRFVHNEYGQCTKRDSESQFRTMSELFILASHIYSTSVRLINNEMSVGALGEREKEILLWVASGFNPVKISDALNISEHTVRNHLKSIRCKLGVRSTTHAVAKAVASNLIKL